MRAALIKRYLDSSVGVTPIAILIGLGDSLVRGRSIPEVAGPTPIPGTVDEWDGNELVPVTDSDVLTAEGGSMWPQLAIDYNASTGHRVIIVNCAIGGSTITDVDDFNRIWTEAGDLWSDAVAKVAGALALPNTYIAGVIISGGINDFRHEEASVVTPPSVAQFKSDYQSLFTRINAEWGSPKKYLFQIGSVGENASADTGPVVAGRQAVLELVSENEDVELVLNTCSYYAEGLMSTDFVHFTQPGNNQGGTQINNYLQLDESIDKRIRAMLSTFTNSLSEAHRNAFIAFFESCISNGNINGLAALQIYVANSSANAFNDFMNTVVFRPLTATFTPNSNIETDGSTNQIITGFIPGFHTSKYLQDDALIGVKFADNKTASGVSGAALGLTTNVILLQQSASGIGYRIHDNTGSVYASKTVFDDNKVYALRRSGGTKYLYENKTQLASAAVASSAFTTPNRSVAIGARRNGSTTHDLRMNAQFEYFFAGQWSLINYDALIDDLEALIVVLKS